MVVAKVQMEEYGLLFIKDLLVKLTSLTSWDCYSIACYFPTYLLVTFFSGRSYIKLEGGLAKFASLYVRELHGIVEKGMPYTYEVTCNTYIITTLEQLARSLISFNDFDAADFV